MAPPPTRRGWCPGVLTPMPTGDGLLVRLHPPAGALTADQARAVAGAARACGNGHLDVTGRGNLQIRGVRVESHPALVERLAAVGLVEPAGHAGAGFGAASRQVVALGPGLPSAIASGIRERGWSLYARTTALFPDGCSEAEPSPGPSATTCEAPHQPSAVSSDRNHHGPIRLTVVSPLAGLDPADRLDARALAERIEAEARGIAGLPAKTCVAVDGGGQLPLDALEADLRLVAVRPHDAPTLAVGLGDEPRWTGTTRPSSAPQAVRALLERFVRLRERWPRARRLKHLPAEADAELAAAAALGPALMLPRREPGPRAGVLDLVGGRAAVLMALPFGRCDAGTLTRAAGWSERFGTSELRLSSWRGLAIPGVARADVLALVGEARRAGLILDPADPRLAVLACPGRPACASATTDTRADAGRIAEAANAVLTAGATIHVSGCPKGCAHPGTADLTLVGDAGAYRIVAGGTAGDAGSTPLPLDAILRRLSAARAARELGEIFEEASP